MVFRIDMKQMLQPYLQLMRLDKPIGAWLLLLPCWWGLAFAGCYDGALYALFAAGAIIMRGAGCVINDMADIEFDRKVERTAQRPLASGQISLRGASIFLFLLLLLGGGVWLQLNETAQGVALAVMPLVALYPFMKRVTWWPQFFLGLTFNWGVFVGWFAAGKAFDPAILFLYASGVFWTLSYDTIYAQQDKKDDVIAGVKSLARWLGDYVADGVFFFMVMALVLFFLTGVFLDVSGMFYVFFVVASYYAIGNVKNWNPENNADCLKRFKNNRDIGLMLFIAALAA